MNQMELALKKAGVKPTFDIPELTQEDIAARILARDRGIRAGKLHKEGKEYLSCPYKDSYLPYDEEAERHHFWHMGFRVGIEKQD